MLEREAGTEHVGLDRDTGKLDLFVGNFAFSSGEKLQDIPTTSCITGNHLHKLWHRITFQKPPSLLQACFSGYLFTVGRIGAKYNLFYSKTNYCEFTDLTHC